MAMPVFARQISSLPEKQGTSNRSVTAWRLKQAEHSIGPTASEELLPLATDERTPEYSLVGLLSAMPQELLNAECGVMWSEKQRGGVQLAQPRNPASECGSESEWVHVAN